MIVTELQRRTTHVPVGHDQAQHLELARDLAQSFNRTYPGTRKDGKGKGKGIFRIPEVMLSTKLSLFFDFDTQLTVMNSNASSNSVSPLTDPENVEIRSERSF